MKLQEEMRERMKRLNDRAIHLCMCGERDLAELYRLAASKLNVAALTLDLVDAEEGQAKEAA
ncbi:hypothetical protein [Sphingobium yanoikuyae]|uniref:hypothetical protein n=1 Tax=Sphingobium yanoikuyae TaxID=13690 RepID=UPI0035C6EF9C